MTDDITTPPIESSSTGTEPGPSGPGLGKIVTGAVLILIGTGWLVEAADWADVPWRALLAGALMVVGAALMLGARSGSHGGLIAFGILLAVALSLSSAVAVLADIPLTGGIGEQRHHPTEVVDDEYRWGIGSMTVDLRSADHLDGTTVVASVAIGELVVYVPAGIEVQVDARAGIGEVRVFGEARDGFDAAVQTSAAQGSLILDLDVAIGKVEVRR
ncbi:MAG: cell wall-active antibiotics response protein [Acidimicrobiia bacterium]|nr:cell wall-active antibiotics response protein [Acidimicrobiia bacterium]